MEPVIIYASKYGTAKKYAQYLATWKQFPIASIEELSEISLKGKVPLFFGSIYAGNLYGIKELFQVMTPNQSLYIFPVGLTNPDDEFARHDVQKMIEKTTQKKQLHLLAVHHLHGALDYQQLSFPHRLVIKALSKSIQKKETPTELERAFSELCNRPLDFIDYQALKACYLETDVDSKHSS